MAESKASTPTPIVAAHPFDQPSADITLRTPDLVDFHVHSQILSQASPIFADMLTLPQPFSSFVDRPVVDVSEDSKTLENLLRLCYPVAKPKVADLAELALLLEATMKYEMMGILTLVLPDFLHCAPREPLKVWAIACRYGPVLESAARCAAARMMVLSKDSTLLPKPFCQLLTSSEISSTSLPPLRLLKVLVDKDEVDALRGISAGNYYRLLEFVRTRGEQSSIELLSPPPTPATDDSAKAAAKPLSLDGLIPRIPPPDVKIQCPDGSQYRTHMIFLAMHCPTLEERIREVVAARASNVAPAKYSGDDSELSLPVLEMDVDATTLAMLLALCYAGTSNSKPDLPSDIRLLTSTLVAARKLGMGRVEEAARERWERAADTAPLEAYFVAVERGQHDLARLAARKALEGPIVGVYVRSMEACPALAYHRLLEYRLACAHAVHDAMEATVPQLKERMEFARNADDHEHWRIAQCRRTAHRDILHRSPLGKTLVDLLYSDPAGALPPELSPLWPFCSQGMCWGGVAKLVISADSLPQAVADAVAKVQLDL